MTHRNGRSATLYDFRDLDLMMKLEAEADPEGWVETEELARALGFGDERLPIAQRLSWMRRFGMIEQPLDAKHRVPTRWRLSASGLRVVRSKIKASQMRQLEAIPEEALIDVMANVTSRYHLGSPMIARMLRREFDYGTRRR